MLAALARAQDATPRAKPFYTVDALVNSADYQPGALAPNSIGTLFGQGLSYVTKSLDGSQISGGVLPLGLPGSGVNVIVGGILATVYYVSPTQINFLVPSILLPGPTNLQVVSSGTSGPLIPLDLKGAAPGLYQLDATTAVATHLDGTVVTADAPAHPGEIVTLWATGLGDTVPPIIYRNIATQAAPLDRLADFTLLLDGAAVDPTLVLYAGIAPGFAGLYQINLRLPASVGPDPQVQIGVGDAVSPTGVLLPVSVQ